MGDDKILYLYAATNIWLQHRMRSVQSLFALAEKFYIVSTSAQIDHLKSELFGAYLLDIEILDENPSPEEIKLIRTKSPEFFKDYSLFQAGLAKYVKYVIPVDTDELEEQISQRIEAKLPPLFTGNDQSDIFSWVAILQSPKLPMGAEIYIYSNGEDFLYQKNIHPYLSHEWKYIKRGVIRAYDPSMFTQKASHAVPDYIAPPVRDGSNTPEFLRARFIAVLDEVVRNLAEPRADHNGARPLLEEAKQCIEKMEGKASVDTVTVMKRLYNETLHRFQAVMGIHK